MTLQDEQLHGVFLMSLFIMVTCAVVMATVFLSDRYQLFVYGMPLFTSRVIFNPFTPTVAIRVQL